MAEKKEKKRYRVRRVDPATGKMKSFYSRKSKKDAQKQADEYVAARKLSNAFGIDWLDEVKNKTLVDQCLWYVEKIKGPEYSVPSYKRDLRLIRHYIQPFFGEIYLRDVTKAKLMEFFQSASMLAISADYRKKAAYILNNALEYGLSEGYCTHNPMRLIKLREAPPLRSDLNVLTGAESRLILDYLLAHPEEPPDIGILLKTGLRRGEYLALQQSDVDRKRRILHVTKAIKDEGGVGEPKSATSVRDVPFDEECLELLSRLFARKGPLRPTAGEKLWDPNNWYKRVYRPQYEGIQAYYKEQGIDLPYISPHGCRDTCATNLIRRGVTLVAVSKFLGHADASVTAKFYVKPNFEDLRDALGF